MVNLRDSSKVDLIFDLSGLLQEENILDSMNILDCKILLCYSSYCEPFIFLLDLTRSNSKLPSRDN